MRATDILFCSVAAVALAACGAIPPPSVGQRVEYWDRELSKNLPAGTPRAAVEKYFSDRGLRYRSGARTEGGPAQCENSEVEAVEPGVARGVMTAGWDVQMYVCLDKSGNVSRHKVVGFNHGF